MGVCVGVWVCGRVGVALCRWEQERANGAMTAVIDDEV